nr:MAG TPA: hypothetical protein [Caudoviricetes sp.]
MVICVICAAFSCIIVALSVLQYLERRELYNRIMGNQPKKHIKPPSAPKSAHEKVLEDWRRVN